MTLKMMSEAGIESEFAGNTVSIAPQAYKAWNFRVEGDWSAAAAWYEIEALSSGTVTIDNLCREVVSG